MARIVPEFSKHRPVATERELLNFANRVRDAGGADFLKKLLPAYPEQSTECLIARALNFHCEITPWAPCNPDRDNGRFSDGSEKWIMIPHHGNTEQSEKKARELAPKISLRLLKQRTSMRADDEPIKYGLQLPRHIGNAAEAFDLGMAFEKLNINLPSIS